MVFDFIKKKKHSVIYSWIISYLLIIMIPLLTTGIIYYIVKDSFEQEINALNETLLEKTKDNLDNILSSVEHFSIEVILDPNVRSVLATNEINNEGSYYTLFSAATRINNYKFFNNTLIQYYIYFNKLKTVVAPNTVFDQEAYYNKYFTVKGFSMEKWLKVMEEGHKGDYIVMPYHDKVKGDIESICYIQSLPIPVHTNVMANMVMLLDLNDYLLISKNDNGNGRLKGSKILIMGENGGIIAGSATDKEISGLEYNQMSQDHGNLNRVLDGRKVVISYVTSKVNGWKYITVTEEAVFWQKAQFVRNIMAAGLIICILLSGFLSYFFLRKNYNPLRDIVSYFQNKTYTNMEWKSNEYMFIKNTMKDILDEKDVISLKLEEQNKALKSKFIAALLKGRSLSLPVDELMASYNIPFQYRYFSVILVYIINIDETFGNENSIGNLDKYSMSKFIITNILEEITNRNGCGYITDVDEMLACLVNMDNSKDDIQEELLCMIREAKDFIEQHFKITLAFSLGSLHENMKGIPEAFKEAVNAMEYSRVMELNSTVCYDDINRKNGSYYYFPIEKEYQLINSIKSADYPAAEAIIEEIFQKNFINNTPSLDITRCLTFNFISSILKSINEINEGNEKDLIDKLNPVSELLKCNSYMEIERKILQIVKSICEFVSISYSKMDCRVKEIVSIIEKNYNDPNLCIENIAEQIGNHPNYISRMYKMQTSEGILDCINRVRINKAKELMKKKTWNQEEIAKEVGYTNVRTFQRAFKRFEGTPPGKIR